MKVKTSLATAALILSVAAWPLVVCTNVCYASMVINALNIPVLQDFNGLVNSGTSSAMPNGWAFSESGTSSRKDGMYAAGIGSSDNGDTYSFGASGSNDRALGGLLSGTLSPTFGVEVKNETAGTIVRLVVSYTGEQWRLGTSGRADRLDFQYSTAATALDNGNGTWTDVNSLDFSSPITLGSVGALNGNDAANRLFRSATISGLSVAPGATIWFRWTDFNALGADDGLAVDDFSITAVPEPTTMISGAGALGLLLLGASRHLKRANASRIGQ